MPSQDAKRALVGRRLSRRSLLHGVATAGAAGLAVTAIGSAASPALAATRQDGERDQRHQEHGHEETRHVDGPIVVHVRDAKSGDMDVLYGDGKTRLFDADLAARIARAIG
jgi:hypothetical protein